MGAIQVLRNAFFPENWTPPTPICDMIIHRLALHQKAGRHTHTHAHSSQVALIASNFKIIVTDRIKAPHFACSSPSPFPSGAAFMRTSPLPSGGERTYVPRYLCSPVPMLPGTPVPMFPEPMFPGTYVPRYLYSPNLCSPVPSAGLRSVEAPGQQCYRKVVNVMSIST